ncbi:ABC transporter ATP-binding protein [Agrococcus sp. Marseille-Q4369]|uniref:ABC transporter ATP-binding protein n=1 Tax=Agrococcus sp. Marseille-Q4369 TaxID=2810513 RepID=UPI001B8B3283|nr:ABC transporter ATP-binding protein [Agrococcus sp. Marseille-Q4369]QUW18537.1 ABC transporter ATP-binding protein [Agrococcus sp. Marseille-Q4369]
MLWKLIVRYVRPSMLSLLLVVLFQFVQSVLTLMLPTINADIIDEGVLRGDTDTVWRLGVLMLALSLGQVAANVLAILFGARLAMRAGRDLRADLFGKVGDFSEQDVQRFGAASLITRNTNDVQQVQMLILMSCTMLLSAPMMAIGGVIMAIRADATLSWLIAVSVPLMLVVLGFLVSRLVPIFRQLQERIDRINKVLREQLTGIRVIRAFVQERREKARFAVANDDVTDAMIRTGNLFVLMFPVIMLIVEVSSVAVIWFGAGLVDRGELEIGTMMAFLQYLMQILMGVLMATFMTIMIPRAAVSARRIGEVLETEPTIERVVDGREQVSPGTVELRDVVFRYPGADHPVIDGVSLRAEPGETLAIIGSTGAGKTTLVNLIPRLFDATGGAVLVGGVDVRELDAEALWRGIALVPQRPYLFAGTVASNLRYGNEDATDEQLWRALEIAQAAGFVQQMPKQLESRIAQGGTNVSGGQRQRLSIARALVAEPDVLVFDDSFSALDLTTDARLRAALRDAVGETTQIVVAQRVSTIVDADRIVVLDRGCVVGSDTHEELLAGNDTYREIVESQMAVEA